VLVGGGGMLGRDFGGGFGDLLAFLALWMLWIVKGLLFSWLDIGLIELLCVFKLEISVIFVQQYEYTL